MEIYVGDNTKRHSKEVSPIIQDSGYLLGEDGVGRCDTKGGD